MSQQINLFNPQFEPQRNLLSARTMAGATVALVVLLAAIGGYEWQGVRRLEAQAIAGDTQLGKAQKRLEEAATTFAPRHPDAGLEADVADAESQRDALRRIADVIARGDLGNTQGYAEYFRALARQSVDGLWLTGVSIAGAGLDIGVRGRALDPALVPGYLARLRNEPVLQGKPVGSMQISQAAPLRVRDADGKDADAPAPYVEFSLQSAPTAAGSTNAEASPSTVVASAGGRQ